MLQAGEEVAAVPRGLEADQVVGQEGLEDLPAPGELEQDVQRRERDVEEEAHLRGLVAPPQEFRHVDELVVLHPDEVAVPPLLGHGVGEFLVDFQVGVPEGRLEVAPPQHVVEQGPEDRVREALVESLDLLLGEEHRDEIVAALAIALLQHSLPGPAPLQRQARPAHPEAAAVGEHRRNGAHQAAGPGLQDPAGAPLLEDDGEAVGDDEQALRHGISERLQ